MIIAIDGPAGSGKSTIARAVAARFGFRYIDSGAMYRAVAWQAMEQGINLNDEDGLARVAREMDIEFVPGLRGQTVRVNGIDADAHIRTEEVGSRASIVATFPKVREVLTAKQRETAMHGPVVMDGRDIGSVVFPQADKKFYLDAAPEERGKRRYLELKAKHQEADLNRIIDQVRQRDHEDMNRDIAPLIRAPDALYLDTTKLNIEEVINLVVGHIGSAGNVKN